MNFLQLGLDRKKKIPRGVRVFSKEITPQEVRSFVRDGCVNIAMPEASGLFLNLVAKELGIKFPNPQGGQGVVYSRGDRILKVSEVCIHRWSYFLLELR